MTGFTREQLKEIEKVFDIVSSKTQSEFADNLETYSKYRNNPVLQEHVNKLVHEAVWSFDTLRTISAVANKMQEIEDSIEISPSNDEMLEEIKEAVSFLRHLKAHDHSGIPVCQICAKTSIEIMKEEK